MTAEIKKNSEDGYTLLEILVVLAILALIATFVVPNLMKVFGSAKADVAAIQMGNLRGVLDIYRLENGDYPSQEDGLQALVSPPGVDTPTWNGPYIDKPEGLTDPWGNPYHYEYPGSRRALDIYSFGADNAEGGDGENADIWN